MQFRVGRDHAPVKDRSSFHQARRAIVCRVSLECVENVFRQQRNRIKVTLESVADGINDGWRGTIHRQFANSFRSVYSENIADLLEVNSNRRKISRSRHNIVGHLAILHAAFFPNYFFVQREPNSLRDAANNLSGSEDRMQNFAYFLNGYEGVNHNAVGSKIDGDL